MYLCDYCGNETSHKASTVKEHVEAERGNLVCFNNQQKRARIELSPVRDEAKGVSPDPIEELDEGEGEVEEEEQPTKMPQLKLKWRAVSRILYAVSSFQPATAQVIEVNTEKFRPRSWSDPELECRIRNNEDFDLNDIMNARRATNTP